MTTTARSCVAACCWAVACCCCAVAACCCDVAAVLAVAARTVVRLATPATDTGVSGALVLVSALGGSRFQIGGPAGAFIVLVAATAVLAWVAIAYHLVGIGTNY